VSDASTTQWYGQQKRNGWQTPDRVLEPIQYHYPIDLDPCAGRDTDIGDANWSIHCDENGLSRGWDGFENVYVNPPFCDKCEWVEKAVREYRKGNVERVFLLTPADPTTRSWFHGTDFSGVSFDGEYGIVDALSYVWIPDGRVKFLDPESGEKEGSPTSGSIVSVFGSVDFGLRSEWKDDGTVMSVA
jgi:phage N-6-adenine-methyltransferase